ncbi:DUF883 family protein [Rhizobium halophytocola]|uniref:ElaB/YqjD/DUF883 family membrane-anchored ribosome-binding protein n=1 Tax=Rhizobium halophytocola TaxID=735519 RepID=A0ABS4E0H5_9HYPH|nr:DUF883 family protein [Rhizobium halophytocola]MBP1851442.1 ElaB/YqjD/DUF883 family membrane-anchored ribosome-binding protein [Rhizobium halophytocola]
MAVAKAEKTTATSTDTLNDAPSITTEDLEAQLSQLRSDISSLADLVATFGAERAESYRRKATEFAGDAKEAAKTQISEMEEDLSNRIRRNPLQSVAIAAGVGFVAALLSRR